MNTLRIYVILHGDISTPLYVESNFKVVTKSCRCPTSGTAVNFWTDWARQAKLQAEKLVCRRTFEPGLPRLEIRVTCTQLIILLSSLTFSKILISNRNFLFPLLSVCSVTLRRYVELFNLPETFVGRHSRLVTSGYQAYLF